MRLHIASVLVAALLLAAPAAPAATYKGRNVDGRWFQGQVVNHDFGAFDCQVRFREDRAAVKFIRFDIQMEGFLEDEVITDPRRITLYDPLRGVYWTLEVYNLGV